MIPTTAMFRTFLGGMWTVLFFRQSSLAVNFVVVQVHWPRSSCENDKNLPVLAVGQETCPKWSGSPTTADLKRSHTRITS